MKSKFKCATCGCNFVATIQKGYNTNWCSKKCRYNFLIKSILGKKINKLLIIREVEPKVFYRKRQKEIIKMVECLCDCGSLCEMAATRIKSGKIKSCGCLRDNSYKINCVQTKHGLWKHPLFHIWVGMRQRCYNPNSPAYANYGGRGVRVCDEWNADFVSFYNWAIQAGWDKGLEIDKDIKANKIGIEPLLYSPDTCSFVTRKLNTNARRGTVYVELNGEKIALSLACDMVGLKLSTVYCRMKKNGLDFKKAIFDAQIKI